MFICYQVNEEKIKVGSGHESSPPEPEFSALEQQNYNLSEGSEKAVKKPSVRVWESSREKEGDVLP